MITLADFREHYLPKVEEKINNELKNRDKNAYWSKIFKDVSSDTQYVQTKQRESMGPLQMTPAGSDVPELNLGDGYNKRIFQYKFSGMIRYSMEVLLFDQLDIIAEH